MCNTIVVVLSKYMEHTVAMFAVLSIEFADFNVEIFMSKSSCRKIHFFLWIIIRTKI